MRRGSPLLGAELDANRESPLHPTGAALSQSISTESLFPPRILELLALGSAALAEIPRNDDKLVRDGLGYGEGAMAQSPSGSSGAEGRQGTRADRLRGMPVQKSARLVEGKTSAEIAEYYRAGMEGWRPDYRHS